MVFVLNLNLRLNLIGAKLKLTLDKRHRAGGMGSGSAAAEHLTNPAEGKRPREMPTESVQSIKTMDLHLS